MLECSETLTSATWTSLVRLVADADDRRARIRVSRRGRAAGPCYERALVRASPDGRDSRHDQAVARARRDAVRAAARAPRELGEGRLRLAAAADRRARGEDRHAR